MYSAQTTNGGNDGLGTINPGVLNSVGQLSNSTATITPDTSPNPRGLKRSRSPDTYDTSDQLVGDDGTWSPAIDGYASI